MNAPRPARVAPATAALLIAAAIGASGAAAKPAAVERSEIKFLASQSDVPIEGAFKRFSADVDFDPANPARGKVSVTVDTSTVATGSSDADGLIVGKDFFDAAHFPQATFASSSIAPADAGKFVARGQFSLKGHSQTLAIPFSARSDGGGTWYEGRIPLSRLAYKVGEGEWADTGTVADEVTIRFKLFVPR